MTLNTVAWFEVATTEPDAAQRFYTELFGWTFAPDPEAAKSGTDYRVVTYPAGDRPVGGILATGGSLPDHAVFFVAVADVADTCARAEQLGAKVAFAQPKPASGPPLAYLRDRSGNLFGIFTPPPE
jgi:uncharacterized protein